jgi:4-amino-4-deoxy-L-arabinose transferase-like glycosyltransferase
MKAFAPALAALGAAVAAAAVAFLWQPGLDSLYDDSVSYLLMAQRFTPFHALEPAVAAAAAHEKYPPLFALLLAASGGAYDWRIAHAVVALCFAASVVMLVLFTAGLTGSRLVGLIAGSAYALLPGSWIIAKGILSEYPYIALTLTALWVYRNWDERPATRRTTLGFGVLLAAVMLTRTVGVALLGAIALAELWRFARARDRERMRTMALSLGVAGRGLVRRAPRRRARSLPADAARPGGPRAGRCGDLDRATRAHQRPGPGQRMAARAPDLLG